jgi:hypothetical protein
MAQAKTVVDCLSTIGVTPEFFQAGLSTAEEFQKIKKLYFEGALSNHPDKGGDAVTFRELQVRVHEERIDKSALIDEPPLGHNRHGGVV